MSVLEINPSSKEWVDQIKKNIEQDQAALNQWLKDSFNAGNLDGIERALVAGADPNLSMYYSSKPTLFSDDGFNVTFLDIIENSHFFEGEQRARVYRIFIDHGAFTTEEGARAFRCWFQKQLSIVAPQKRSSHKNCLVEVTFKHQERN